MARLSGSWNFHAYKNNEWITVINDVAHVKVSPTNVVLSASSGVVVSGGLSIPDSDFSITGDATVTGDLSATGGYWHSYTQYANKVLQGEVVGMTSSYIYLSASDPASEVWYTAVPMVRSGSVVGLCVKSLDGAVDDSNGGALTASVVVGSTKTSAEVIITTGSFGDITVAKDTAGNTFNPGQSIYVILTSSADYLNDVATSCSWVANIMVES